MLEEYNEMLDSLKAELFTDLHAHCDDILVTEYIEQAIQATEILKRYIVVMNEKFN